MHLNWNSTTAEQHAAILTRDAEQRAGQASTLVGHEVYKSADGPNGHVKWGVQFAYIDGAIRRFDGTGWSTVRRV
jgi:hypothetical protein